MRQPSFPTIWTTALRSGVQFEFQISQLSDYGDLEFHLHRKLHDPYLVLLNTSATLWWYSLLSNELYTWTHNNPSIYLLMSSERRNYKRCYSMLFILFFSGIFVRGIIHSLDWIWTSSKKGVLCPNRRWYLPCALHGWSSEGPGIRQLIS